MEETTAMRLERLRSKMEDWATDPTRVERNRVVDLIHYVGGLAGVDRSHPGYSRPYFVAGACLEEVVDSWDLLSELLERACDPPEEGEE
tara:strand:+ start:4389 stop:4655 length:267 start_codon:yes stop_codon:yes gene_type:complete